MFWLFLPAAAAMAAMLPALGRGAPLNLKQALELAARRSQAVRAARIGTSSAAEAACAAGQLPDPIVSVGIGNLPATGPARVKRSADFMTIERVGVSQEWVSPEKGALRRAAAQAPVGRKAVAEQVALADTRLQAALADLDACHTGKVVELTELTEHHAHEEFELRGCG